MVETGTAGFSAAAGSTSAADLASSVSDELCFDDRLSSSEEDDDETEHWLDVLWPDTEKHVRTFSTRLSPALALRSRLCGSHIVFT